MHAGVVKPASLDPSFFRASVGRVFKVGSVSATLSFGGGRVDDGVSAVLDDRSGGYVYDAVPQGPILRLALRS